MAKTITIDTNGENFDLVVGGKDYGSIPIAAANRAGFYPTKPNGIPAVGLDVTNGAIQFTDDDNLTTGLLDTLFQLRFTVDIENSEDVADVFYAGNDAYSSYIHLYIDKAVTTKGLILKHRAGGINNEAVINLKSGADRINVVSLDEGFVIGDKYGRPQKQTKFSKNLESLILQEVVLGGAVATGNPTAAGLSVQRLAIGNKSEKLSLYLFGEAQGTEVASVTSADTGTIVNGDWLFYEAPYVDLELATKTPVNGIRNRVNSKTLVKINCVADTVIINGDTVTPASGIVVAGLINEAIQQVTPVQTQDENDDEPLND